MYLRHFSSPEPKAQKVSLYDGYAPASVVIHILKIFPLKPLDQSKPNFMLSILGKGKQKYLKGQGHMTKMAAVPNYGKRNNNIKIFSGTGGQISTKLGM